MARQAALFDPERRVRERRCEAILALFPQYEHIKEQ